MSKSEIGWNIKRLAFISLQVGVHDCIFSFVKVFNITLAQCWRQSIQSREAKVFLLILALKKHAVLNAITSINNTLK